MTEAKDKHSSATPLELAERIQERLEGPLKGDQWPENYIVYRQYSPGDEVGFEGETYVVIRPTGIRLSDYTELFEAVNCRALLPYPVVLIKLNIFEEMPHE